MGFGIPGVFSFDRITGDLFIADVGEASYEEVDFQSSSSAGGQNYGWNIMEGFHCYNAMSCNQSGLTLPVHEYDHTQGCAINGGFVLRGTTAASLAGWYVYGDYCSGMIWALKQSQGLWENTLLVHTSYTVTTFGEDEAGNMYVADYAGGAIYPVVGM